MNRYIKVILIALLVIAVNITAVYALSTTEVQKNQIIKDSVYIQFNKDMYEFYNIQGSKSHFDENNPDTYVYKPSYTVNGTEYVLDLSKLKQGLGKDFNLKTCLDGSYFVYSAALDPTRKRPSTLTYNTAKRGKTEYQYLGYDTQGAYYDNPAYPWNSWSSSKPLKSWEFIKKPWEADVIKQKYKINKTGGILSQTNMKKRNKVVDLSKNIELGIYAKYIAFTAKETVRDGGVSNADQDKSIYYGYKVGSAELNKKFGFSKPNVFDSSDSWQDYVYILTPPTNTTWGSGFMFYKNASALQGVDYVTIPLAPFNLVEQQKVEKLSINNVTGCFLSHPVKVYNSTTKKYEVKTWVIRATKEPLTTSGSIPVQIWLKKAVDDDNQFTDGGMGTKIFDEDIVFTPEHPYWVKEVTFTLPAKGTMSGIFVIEGDGNSDSAAYNYIWRTDFDTLAYGSHATSAEAEFDSLPWDKFKSEYGIEREKLEELFN